MSIWSTPNPSGRKLVVAIIWLGLPFLGLGFQIAAKNTAEALRGVPWGVDWFVQAVRQPWVYLLVLLEIASLFAWMLVLSNVKLSAAFPMSALSYVLVLSASWFMFNEPGSALQVIASGAILAGVWLIARDRPRA